MNGAQGPARVREPFCPLTRTGRPAGTGQDGPAGRASAPFPRRGGAGDRSGAGRRSPGVRPPGSGRRRRRRGRPPFRRKESGAGGEATGPEGRGGPRRSRRARPWPGRRRGGRCPGVWWRVLRSRRWWPAGAGGGDAGAQGVGPGAFGEHRAVFGEIADAGRPGDARRATDLHPGVPRIRRAEGTAGARTPAPGGSPVAAPRSPGRRPATGPAAGAGARRPRARRGTGRRAGGVWARGMPAPARAVTPDGWSAPVSGTCPGGARPAAATRRAPGSPPRRLTGAALLRGGEPLPGQAPLVLAAAPGRPRHATASPAGSLGRGGRCRCEELLRAPGKRIGTGTGEHRQGRAGRQHRPGRRGGSRRGRAATLFRTRRTRPGLAAPDTVTPGQR
jgi:hypothetical protein